MKRTKQFLSLALVLIMVLAFAPTALVPTATAAGTPDGIQHIATGYNKLAVDANGGLWSWGSGALGPGKREFDTNIPVKILDGVKAVEAGDYWSFAIKNPYSTRHHLRKSVRR
jgi:hypothetical protein